MAPAFSSNMPSTESDRRPSATIWLLAVASLLLPIAGVASAVYGIYLTANGNMLGWVWLLIGVVLLVADLVIDQKWYGWIGSSEPDLNRRGAQLVGQIVVVVDAIPREGRGSVKVADTVWPAEGVEAPAGARVRISGCKDTVLRVGPA
jgi:membrane protein implicated in regulation of membrane protease activity